MLFEMLVFVLIFFFVITIIQFISSSSVVGTSLCAIVTLMLFFLLVMSTMPESTFNLNEMEKQMYQQQQPLFESLPQEYYNDYIKVNQMQSKTVNVYYRMNYSQFTDSITIDIPEVDIYSWSTIEAKYIKNESAVLVDSALYYTTISHGNKSTTFHIFGGSFFLDKQNVPWLFPIQDGTSFNITYTLDLRNIIEPERFNNTIFVIPIKEQSFTYDYTVVVKEGLKIDWWLIYLCVGTSIIVSCIVLLIWYDNRRTRRELERRRLTRRQLQESLRIDSRNQFGDYSLYSTTSKEDALRSVESFRNQGYFTKVINRVDGQCDFWISNWTKDRINTQGIPKWRRRNH